MDMIGEIALVIAAAVISLTIWYLIWYIGTLDSIRDNLEEIKLHLKENDKTPVDSTGGNEKNN